MIDDRSLERTARSWIEEGPTAAPPQAVETALRRIETTSQERDWHVPWRTPPMTLPARLVAAAVIGALVVAGAVALGGLGIGRSTPTPVSTTAPSPAGTSSPSAAAIVAPPLAETFTSSRYGYAVKHPTGWTVAPATKTWSEIGTNLWNSGINDEIHGKDVRFSGASIAIDGQQPDQWIKAYAGVSDPASWPRIDIGGQSGYLTADGSPAAGGAITPSSVYFDVVVVVDGRGYNFDMDGHVDRAYLQAMLDTVTFYAPSALATLEKPATSRWYGYSLFRKGEWTWTPATSHWTGFDNSKPAVDELAITGTDTTVTIASQALPKGKTLDQWLVPFHANTTANVPAGCDGGDPSTWLATPIGDQIGRYYQLCNAAEAVVGVGGRVYVFGWANDTFDAASHFQLQSWLDLLKTVTFDPAKAVDR
jgi:hypothetical protein